MALPLQLPPLAMTDEREKECVRVCVCVCVCVRERSLRVSYRSLAIKVKFNLVTTMHTNQVSKQITKTIYKVSHELRNPY